MKRSTGPSTPDLKGPITRQNFDTRMEWHGTKIKRWVENGGLWPFLSHAPQEYAATADEAAWDQYFLDHLGGYPLSYQLFKNGRIRFYNVPEARPELFDPSYKPSLPPPAAPINLDDWRS